MNTLCYELPLTQTSGKIRIKERMTFRDYGVPIAPTQTTMTLKHYIEWQIGYDIVTQKSENYHFIGANGKTKALYELSEFIKFGFENGFILEQELDDLINFIEQNNELVEQTQCILRANFIPENIRGIEFLKSNVSYPLLVYKFEPYDIICEIIVREKQRASGVMPMLYFCLPISALKDGNEILNRCIKSKEIGILEINRNNIGIFMQMFKIFGILSKAHKHDVLEILKVIKNKKV